MSKFDIFISELEQVLEKLSGLREGLKQMKEEIEAVRRRAIRCAGAAVRKRMTRS